MPRATGREKDGLVWAAPSGQGACLCTSPLHVPRLPVLGLASSILSSNSWWVGVLARKSKQAGLAETLKLKRAHPQNVGRFLWSSLNAASVLFCHRIPSMQVHFRKTSFAHPGIRKVVNFPGNVDAVIMWASWGSWQQRPLKWWQPLETELGVDI